MKKSTQTQLLPSLVLFQGGSHLNVWKALECQISTPKAAFKTPKRPRWRKKAMRRIFWTLLYTAHLLKMEFSHHSPAIWSIHIIHTNEAVRLQPYIRHVWTMYKNLPDVMKSSILTELPLPQLMILKLSATKNSNQKSASHSYRLKAHKHQGFWQSPPNK